MPSPVRAAVVKFAFVRPNKTGFMSGKCLIFGFACGVHRVPVRRARPRSIDVEFDQPKPAYLRPSSTLHPGGANKHRRCPKRPAGARGANATLERFPTLPRLSPASGLANAHARAVDGPQGRDWLVQPCASATSSPGGLIRSGANRCSLNRASVDAAIPASRALRQGVGDHGLAV